MAVRNTVALASLALAAGVAAQSIDPGLGVNSNAQGATEDVTVGYGPNGSEDWLNTGLDGSGWNPPYMTMSDLKLVDIQTFYNNAGSACQQYDQYFQSASSQYNIPAIILAVIAMQESSCDATINTGNGTPGLMQVACENYPDGTCDNWANVQDNVNAGADYLMSQLGQYNNNIIEAMGSYNGWFTGITSSYPCSSQGQANGDPQNLNYLQDIFNGWLVGVDVYDGNEWIGTYACSGYCSGNNQC